MSFFLTDISLTAYFVAWLLLTSIFLWRKKHIGFGGVLLITYTISAFTSIIFNDATLFISGKVIKVDALVYLFVFSNIIMLPVYIHSNELSNFEFKENGSKELLKLFLIVSIPLSFEALLETIVIAINTNVNTLGDIYESEVDLLGDKLSFIGRKTTSIVRWFTYLWPILFWYLLSPNNPYKKYAIGPLLAMLQLLLWAYAGAQRVAIVRYIFYIYIIYLLLKNNIDEKVRSKILLFGGGIVVCSIVLLFLITISRFNNNDLSINIWEWISLYTGEGPMKFCENIWSNTVYQNGDNTISIFKEILGFDTFTDIDEKRDFYLMKGGAPTNIFYTMIGDFVYDFGLIVTGVVSIIIAILINMYFKYIIKRGYVTIASLFTLGLILLSLEFGFMYFCFKQNNVQHSLIYSIVFLLLYRLLKKS